MLGLGLAFAEMLWLLLLLEVGLLTWALAARTQSIIGRLGVRAVEFQQFVRGFALVGTIVSLTLAVTQYGSGASNPACIHFRSETSMSVVSNVAGIGLQLLLLAWLWLGSGARYLARFAPLLFKERQYTADRVRSALTGLIVLFLIGVALLQGRDPAGLEPACRAIQDAPPEMEQWRTFEALRVREL